MHASFSVCATEMYQRKYMNFLMSNYKELHLPYSFYVSFGFIASPILMGQECFLCLDDDGEAIGAFAYIHGTGEGNYENRHIVQLQVVFIAESYRHTTLFLQGLHVLAEHLRECKQEVTELVFWTGKDACTARLFGKFAERTSMGQSAVGYRVTLDQLNVYLAKFRRRTAGLRRNDQ